jgi:hypothetical protein
VATRARDDANPYITRTERCALAGPLVGLAVALTVAHPQASAQIGRLQARREI